VHLHQNLLQLDDTFLLQAVTFGATAGATRRALGSDKKRSELSLTNADVADALADEGRMRQVAVTTVALVLSLGGVAELHAQTLREPPADAPVLAGPLTLAPVIQSNAGHDNNIFNRSESEDTQGDFTATFTPSVDVWLRLPRARAGGRAKADFYYYKDLIDLRAVDWNSDGRLEVPLNRLTPFASGALVSTTNSTSTEDLPSRWYINSTTRGMSPGSFGRGRLHYRESIGADGSPVTYPVEAQYSSGAGIGYRRGRTRVGFRIDYMRRDAESAGLEAPTASRTEERASTEFGVLQNAPLGRRSAASDAHHRSRQFASIRIRGTI
jgi:hypothetical protein